MSDKKLYTEKFVELFLYYLDQNSLMIEMCSIVGISNAIKMMELFGGTTISVPSMKTLRKAYRDVDVYISLTKNYSTEVKKALCKKYSLEIKSVESLYREVRRVLTQGTISKSLLFPKYDMYEGLLKKVFINLEDDNLKYQSMMNDKMIDFIFSAESVDNCIKSYTYEIKEIIESPEELQKILESSPVLLKELLVILKQSQKNLMMDYLIKIGLEKDAKQTDIDLDKLMLSELDSKPDIIKDKDDIKSMHVPPEELPESVEVLEDVIPDDCSDTESTDLTDTIDEDSEPVILDISDDDTIIQEGL